MDKAMLCVGNRQIRSRIAVSDQEFLNLFRTKKKAYATNHLAEMLRNTRFSEVNEMSHKELRSDDSKTVYLVEQDSGMGWAVALIVLILALGFGTVVSMNQSSMNNFKLEQALNELKEEHRRQLAENSVDAAPVENETELPKIEVPKVELPKVDLPKVDAPKIDIPKVELPKMDLPQVKVPEVKLPQVELPKEIFPEKKKRDNSNAGTLPSDTE